MNRSDVLNRNCRKIVKCDFPYVYQLFLLSFFYQMNIHTPFAWIQSKGRSSREQIFNWTCFDYRHYHFFFSFSYPLVEVGFYRTSDCNIQSLMVTLSPKLFSTIDMFSPLCVWMGGMSKLISEVTRDTHFHCKNIVEKRET